jgi:outer membrane protein TolC
MLQDPNKLSHVQFQENPNAVMPRLSVLFVLAAALGEAAAGSDLPAQLTLSEALNIALSNSTNIREALARLDQASGQYQQSRSALLPHLDVSAHQIFRR